MAHLDPIAMSTLSPAGPPPSPAASSPRPRRTGFRPGLGAIRPAEAAAEVGAAPGGDDTYTSGVRASSQEPARLMRRGAPPKFGELLAQGNQAQIRRTQAAHVTSHLNPWIPVPWAHRVAPTAAELPTLDLEAQALGERAQSPVYKVCTSPGTVVLKQPIEGLARAEVGAKVVINLLDGPMLTSLGDEALDVLLETLAASKHTSHWHFSSYDSPGRFNFLPWTRSQSVCGTSALFLHLLTQNDIETAHLVMCKKPVEIALELAESIPEIFTLSLLGRVFGSFVPQVTKSHNDPTLDENDQLGALAVLVAAFLSVHVHADADALEVWTLKLMQRFENSGFEATSANVGLMAGAVLAGNLRYGAMIAARDNLIKKYVWFVVALAFAGLSFVENSQIDGGLTVGAFFLGAIFDSYWPVRDLSLDINRLEGKLRTKMLKVEVFKNAYENAEMMAWIDNVKKCNGY